MCPVARSMMIPAGAFGPRAKVKTFGGISTSEAVGVRLNKLPSAAVCGGIAASVGGLFTSLTITLKVREALRLGMPPSRTVTVTVFVPGPSDSPVGQVTMPEIQLIVIPGGAPTPRLYVRALAGPSGSLA